MVLSDVWDYLDDPVKRAFRSVGAESDRVRTRKLLGALALMSDTEPASRIVRDIQDQEGISLDMPEELVGDPNGPPDINDLSPCVRETLEFFKMHRIRQVSTARLATRLLQLGRGSTVRALEQEGVLDDYVSKLNDLWNK
ncbi:MAG: hypothetical protein ABEH89_00095 [bacterium]